MVSGWFAKSERNGGMGVRKLGWRIWGGFGGYKEWRGCLRR